MERWQCGRETFGVRRLSSPAGRRFQWAVPILPPTNPLRWQSFLLRTATRHPAVTRPMRNPATAVILQRTRDALKTLDFWPIFGVGRGRVVLSVWWLNSGP